MELAPVQIHDVLANKRRKMVIDLLRRERTAMSVREVSEYIAERETGQSPPPRNKRQSAYVALHQTHLPKLDDLGIVEYNQAGNTIELNDEASRQVSVYMETVPKYGISWSEYYASVALLGLFLVAATEVGVPVITAFDAAGWASAVLAVVAASAGYQTVQQGSSFLRRLDVLGEPTEESKADE